MMMCEEMMDDDTVCMWTPSLCIWNRYCGPEGGKEGGREEESVGCGEEAERKEMEGE